MQPSDPLVAAASADLQRLARQRAGSTPATSPGDPGAADLRLEIDVSEQDLPVVTDAAWQALEQANVPGSSKPRIPDRQTSLLLAPRLQSRPPR